MKQIPLSIFMFLLLAILIIGSKKAKKGEFHDNFLNYSIVKGLQGFAALAIILHHVTQEVTQYGRYDKGIINVFVDAGVLFTGMFFFFSGYGLMVSLIKKDDYLKGFLKNRLPAVLIPFAVCNLIFIVVSLVLGYRVKPVELILYITGLVMMNDQMWFIVELAILYIIFYLVFRKRKSDASALGKMAVILVLMTAISLLLGHDGLPNTLGLWFFGEWWYNTTWLFFIGLLVAKYQENIVSFAKRHYMWLLPVGIVLFISLHRATTWMLQHVGYWLEYPGHKGYLEKFETFCVQCPMVIVFVLTFMLLSMKIQFHNKVLSFLGTIALEMYLLQNNFITKLTQVIENDVLFYLSVYAGTILLAYIIHILDSRLIECIRKKRKAN